MNIKLMEDMGLKVGPKLSYLDGIIHTLAAHWEVKGEWKFEGTEGEIFRTKK